jgi:hypothetical protein
MSSMSSSRFGTPGHPQTGNAGPIPSLDQPHTTHQGDTGQTGSVQGKMHEMATGAAEVAGQVRDTARRWAGSAAEAVEHGWESTRHGVEETWDEATAFVRRHPVESLLGAFAVGALIGCCITAASSSHAFDRPRW